jgi:hypothetical protein
LRASPLLTIATVIQKTAGISRQFDAIVMLGPYDSAMIRIPLVVVLSSIVGCCVTASASSLYISASGTFSASDSADTYVAPGKAFNFNFVVNSNPTPLNGSSLGFDVPVIQFSYTLNGAPVNVTPSEIRFNTLANGGLFDVTFGSGLNAAEFDFQGSQLFSGTTTSPTFSANSFAVSSWTFSDPANFDLETPTSLSVQATPTPEPSSVLLLLCGGIALLTVGLRKSVWVR